jgi:ATP-dependent Clp protease protease subunit
MGQLRRDDIDRFFDYSLHVPTRTIFIGGEVEEEMAEFFLKAMHVLLAQSSEPISIIMNSGGGDEYCGLGIYDAIASSHAPVTITLYGMAMSMGSWIPQAADDRVMSQHCCMMLHYGSWGYEENAHVARAVAKENERLMKLMEDTYLRRIREKQPKYPVAKLRKMLIDETYLTADQALELGLIDRILREW